MSPPLVSIVVPLYRSEATVRGFLDALARQTFRDFEVILVDSSPGAGAEPLVSAHGLPALLVRSSWRLLPQAARMEGVARARGELLLFTDPDCYAAPDWVERLVTAHRQTGHAVVGALACHGRGWLDTAVHLCKFSKWLPAGPPRPVDMAPTAGFLCPRALFEAAGGFSGDMLMADATLSRALRARGATLWLEPRAVLEHHHVHRLGTFLEERWSRGVRFGRMKGAWLEEEGRPGRSLVAAAALPLRIVSNLAHAARHALRARMAGTYLLTFPVIAAGFAASVAGESVGYLAAYRARGKVRSAVSS